MSKVYSFLDVKAAMVGPGIAIVLGSEAGVSEEGITVALTEDIGGMQVGADGYGQHSLYANKSGQITVRLMKTSPTNALLSAAYAFQTSAGANYGQNTITITDFSRGDVITAEGVGFTKMPDNTYAKEAGIMEWVFNALRITETLGS
jgi:hypothetical protein